MGQEEVGETGRAPFNTPSPEGCPALSELRRQFYQGGESSVGKSIIVLSSTTILFLEVYQAPNEISLTLAALQTSSSAS